MRMYRQFDVVMTKKFTILVEGKRVLDQFRFRILLSFSYYSINVKRRF
ncbi:protein of unknown function [Clostridium beijerinckii]|nr:protein of unknown function [Clostridium beijerinckii]